ncbi:MAG: ABC transporter ATP-binding protein [Treponema sp.]|jgi:energy-coupling factor transport system ATP-binding protein|nr:ABC transporter ATP-binding protein [Treponema sp.]
MIALRGVCFSYGTSDSAPGAVPGKGAARDPVLKDINLRIETGECVVLTGRSGNGKTTLTRVINGLAPSYYGGSLAGEVLIDGKPLGAMPSWERARVLGNVFQDPQSQFFSGELAGEIAFACENLGFPLAEIRRRTDGVIRDMNLDSLRRAPLDRLSSGAMQKAAIASVRSVSPDIYVFDEPSANLDEGSSWRLAEIVSALKQQGHTLIIAEHRLSYLMDTADRIVYLDQGSITAEYSPAELRGLSAPGLRALGLRSPERIEAPRLPSPAEEAERGDREPAIEARDLSYRAKANTILAGVSLRGFPGMIAAVTGRNGVGKTTLGKILCGLLRERGGKVLIRGKPAKPGKRLSAVWRGANNTGAQFLAHSAAEELLLLSPRSGEELERAGAVLKGLGLHEYRNAHPETLSGGQKQRLSLACGVFSGRDICIFDEPTSGLDGEGLVMVSRCLREMARAGKTIFIITHDAELIRECCTHCIALDGLRPPHGPGWVSGDAL